MSAGPDTQRALLAAMGVPAATGSEAREPLAGSSGAAGRAARPRRTRCQRGHRMLGIPLRSAAEWHLELEARRHPRRAR